MHTVSAAALSALPSHLAQAVWPGHALGQGSEQRIASGHPELDAELPGGGWPCQSLTEVLQGPGAQGEWRLLGPALAQLVRQGGSVLLIGPPQHPHLPGLARAGLPQQRLIWVDAHTQAERLWATEQALKSGCVSAVLSWLPQARPEQLRRLQACAAQHPGLLFALRPLQAQAEASAAPLRLSLALGPCPHPLLVQLFKRRGPAMSAPLRLDHWPAGLPDLWPPSQVPGVIPGAVPGITPATVPTAIDLPVQVPLPPPLSPLSSPALTPSPPPHVELDRPAALAARSPVRRHRGERRRGLIPIPGG
jgi:protein ImuA